MINAENEHGRIWTWSGDQHFLRAVVEVSLTFVETVEDSCRLDYVIRADRRPVQLRNVSEINCLFGKIKVLE